MYKGLVQEYIKKKKVVPATFDPVFKAVLKDASTRDYLVNLINGITQIPKDILKDNINFSDGEIPIERVIEKGKTVDLLIDVKNMKINIELNMSYYDGVTQKSYSYAHKISGTNYQVGEHYKDERYTIQINIDMYDIFKEKNGPMIRKCYLTDNETKRIVDKYFIIYHVNLDKTLKKYYNKEKLTTLEKSLVILTLEDKEKIKEISEGEEILMSVEKKIEELSLDEEIVGLYDVEKVAKKVHNSKMLYAEKIGFEKGVKKEKIDIATKLKKENISVETIAKTTGLSVKEIEDIK